MTSPVAAHAFDRDLRPGERLLWTGQPLQGLRLRPTDVVLIPFSLLWGGFAFFWEANTLRAGGSLFSALWGVPFVLVGLYMIVGRFFVDARLRANTYFGLTDRRALIRSGLSSHSLLSLDLRALPQPEILERADGTGSIRFGVASYGKGFYEGLPFPGPPERIPPAFELIAEVRQVLEALRRAQDSVPAGA